LNNRKDVQYFAEWLSRTMASRGITGGQVARAVGVNESAVSKWRAGLLAPSLESLEKLAEFLKVDFTRLAVTAGRLKAEAVKSTAFPLPPDTAQRQDVRDQIARIRGLTDAERRRLLEAYDESPK
jgi:transcriptional regulator with XRE-family HTH domain